MEIKARGGGQLTLRFMMEEESSPITSFMMNEYVFMNGGKTICGAFS